jgi:hypothetical protein
MPTTLMRNGNAQEIIDFLTTGKFVFELSSSNYTTKIKSELVNRTFVLTMQSKRTFAAFAKLKADLKNFEVPNIAPESVRYFHHDFKKDANHNTVINIDLKSAYARIFFNDKMISPETFKYFNSCKKQERLASVGMLASRKKIFQFKNGKPISYVEQVSPLSGFFFYCVKRTQEIMQELKAICGQHYLFTWVDGIYFIPDEGVLQKCVEYLQSVNFLFSCDTLEDFKVKILRNKTYLTFKKEGKLKRFNLPSSSSNFKKIIMEAIISLNKQKQNEKSKIKNSY